MWENKVTALGGSTLVSLYVFPVKIVMSRELCHGNNSTVGLMHKRSSPLIIRLGYISRAAQLSQEC